MIEAGKLLRKYRLTAKKRLGQHFLSDPGLLDRIVDLAALDRADRVVEIGPGLGTLTEVLTRRAGTVIAYETDRRLVALLVKELGPRPGLEIRLGDALRVDYPALARETGGRLKMVANLPYQISTPLLFKLVEEREAFTSLTLMFQKEVADRLAASPGKPGYGALTVFINLWTDVRRGFDIPRSAFHPPPAVDSTVLQFEVLRSARIAIPDEPFFKSVVRSAFAYRRKTLANALARSEAVEILPGEAQALLASLGLEPRSRGEALDLESFVKLTEALREYRSG